MRGVRICVGSIALLSMVVWSHASPDGIGSRLRAILVAKDGKLIVDFLRGSEDSVLSLSSYHAKAAFMHEISDAIRSLQWQEEQTMRLLSELESLAQPQDFLLHMAFTRIPWDVLENSRTLDGKPWHLPDKLEHGLIALRNARDADWFAIAATSVCWSVMERTPGFDAAIDSARTYLAHPNLSETGKASLSYTAGRLLTNKLTLGTDLVQQNPEELLEAESHLRTARESSEASLWLWAAATNELAYLKFKTGAGTESMQLLSEVIERPGVPSTERASAFRQSALQAEVAKDWENALTYYEALRSEDQTHSILLGFDLDERIEELRRRRDQKE